MSYLERTCVCLVTTAGDVSLTGYICGSKEAFEILETRGLKCAGRVRAFCLMLRRGNRATCIALVLAEAERTRRAC